MTIIDGFARWVLREEMNHLRKSVDFYKRQCTDTSNALRAADNLVDEVRRNLEQAQDDVRCLQARIDSEITALTAQRDEAVRLQIQDAARIANAMTALQMVIAKDRLDHAMGPTSQLAHHPQALR